jgi:hypothetical protein
LVAEAMGLYELSVGMWLLTSAWGIVELGLAGLAAGWLYHEGEPAVM